MWWLDTSVDAIWKVSMVYLSSSLDEKGLILDTSWDKEFTRRLFGNLNHAILGPPDDGKVIILSDSYEEEEVHEVDAADIKAVPSSSVKPSAPTDFAIDADDADKGRSPDRTIGSSSSGVDEASLS
jgi:hypothetical protein